MQTEPALPERHPEIDRTANGFLGSIVEIIPKTGTDLTFHFDCRAKAPLAYDNDVPSLARTIVAGQLDACAKSYMLTVKARRSYEFHKQIAESIQMLAARYLAAGAGITYT